ncbi:hypothetical protein BDFB_007293 [Asbolus verrucosus]|uniref:Sanpodo n=1 Tax=Asbolus verrucosus TaxID=1661398 RepID=A0A482W821_ASBVE|nr:hypothetical protein BDFB_007293 [Asbolus verrucosus]
MANRTTSHKNYYSNPAFSQQSEFYNGKPLSQIAHQNVRQSPVGAQAQYHENERRNYDEQEFYEEMLVDDAGIIKEKKVLVVSSPSGDQERYDLQKTKPRYEYIPMQEQGNRYIICQKNSPNKVQVHRYAVIETTNNEELVQGRPNHRYEYIQGDYSPPRAVNRNRYEYIQCEPPSPRKIMNGNPTATQKLHELLSTPKKSPKPVNTRPILSPHAQRRLPPSPQQDPFLTPKKNTTKSRQKLNYTLGTRQIVQQDKRHTAIVAPICSSPIQSIYSETTFSHKTESWMNLGPKKPTQLTLAVAAVMMMLCGGVTSGLCFYMVSIMGRLYFLDFGIVAGFTCLVLGLLGFRTRNCYWLPNRNYISGYIILSVFSLLMCAGLLVLLVLQPKPGTPLADMTSGAVCGISVLSLVLACVGVVTSYCCKYPPPDNRVEHSVPGFTV